MNDSGSRRYRKTASGTRAACGFAMVLLFVAAGFSQAAPPSVTYLFPAGAQRGTTAEITAAGSFDKWPAKVWASSKHLSIEPSKDKGKFAVKVAVEATPGIYWLRAYNEDGCSNLRPFIVGNLPELAEKEPNDDPKTAQVLKDPAVVNGKLAKAGEVDCFAIIAKRGQTLIASVEANRILRSPMDAVVQIVSPDGFVLDENHDYHGLDPQVAYEAPKDGTYIVRVFAFPAQPDTTIRFAGGDPYIYRLTITTGPFLDSTMPLAAGPNVKTVKARGWNLSDDVRTLPVPPIVHGETHVTVSHPKIANSFRLRTESFPVSTSNEAPFTPPFAITQSFAKPGETAIVRFIGKKGQTVAIAAESRSLGLAVDPVLRILDKDQKQLARTEPPKLASDTTLPFTPPADGEYSIAVNDLYSGSGMRSAFLLRATLPASDYSLEVAADRFVLPPGKSLDIPVKIVRKNGFARPVEVAAEGLPEGVKFEIKPAAKPDPNLVTVVLSADKSGISIPFRLIGKVKDEPALSRLARAPLVEFEESTADLWLAVGDSPAAAPKKKK